MFVDHEWFSPTRTLGLASYGISFLACAWRWEICRRGRNSGSPFALLAGIQLYLFFDIAFDWRWKLHDLEDQIAGKLGIYQLRHIPQLMALIALSIALALATTLILHKWRRSSGVALAVVGTVLALGLWCSEVISLHFMDRFLYRLEGKVMVVSLAWVILAAVTCLGVWIDSRDLRRDNGAATLA